MPILTFKLASGQSNSCNVNKIVDSCPVCNRHIEPIQIISQIKKDQSIESINLCVNSECKSYFISYFKQNGRSYEFQYSLPKTIIKNEFSEQIQKTSPIFIEIYNQAFVAEQERLHHIAGVGFRKSLEFLIKDYLIVKTPEEEEKIRTELLGNSIKNRIFDQNIKSCAERAAWLGNDETHFTKKWEDKDINDLKLLLQLTVKWIEAEILTKSYLENMSS